MYPYVYTDLTDLINSPIMVLFVIVQESNFMFYYMGKKEFIPRRTRYNHIKVVLVCNLILESCLIYAQQLYES